MDQLFFCKSSVRPVILNKVSEMPKIAFYFLLIDIIKNQGEYFQSDFLVSPLKNKTSKQIFWLGV